MFKNINWKFVLKTTILLVMGTCAIAWYPRLLHPQVFGADWLAFFRPAVEAILAGRSPFGSWGYFSPPWLLPLLFPFVLLPYPFDIAALALCGWVVYVVALRKFGASWYIVALFILSPPLAGNVMYGNIDWLVALGFTLPPPIGMMLVSIKPQAGLMISLFWIIEAWRSGGWRKVLITITPTAILTILSFVIFGFWIFEFRGAIDLNWNIAHFPYLLPVGIVLMYKALRERKQNMSITAAPFFAPYVGMHSVPLAIMGLLPNETECIASIIGLWLAFALYTVGL